jgi:virulence factor Mce-like protein
MRRNQKQGLTPFAVGAIVLALIAVGTYLGFTKEIPFRHHYTVRAVFKSANNIRKNSPVRIAGVTVGKVVEVKRLDPGAQAAIVKMRIDKKGLPIHKDARLAIRPRIFLEGNFFVDVSPGSPSAPTIDDGDTIPINQTRAPVQLDQILTTLQADTRRDLQRLLVSLSQGLAGEGGAGFNRSIPYWKSAYRDGAIVADASRGVVEDDLSSYIRNAGATAEALDRDRPRLKSLITDFNTTANAFALRDVALERAVAELPRTLHAAQPALAALNASFPSLRRFIADFRPAVRSSGPALDASIPFVRQARGLVQQAELRGLVHDLRPTVPKLAVLNGEIQPLYEQVRLASSCQNTQILPWSKDRIQDAAFPTKRLVYEEATKPLGGLAGESRSGDANGQWFRVLLTGGNYAYPAGADRFFLTGAPIMGANPPAPAQRPPLRADVPCETQQAPDLRTNPADPPRGFRLTLPDTARARNAKAAAKLKAIKWLRGQLKLDQLSSEIKVTTKDVTAQALAKLRSGRR